MKFAAELIRGKPRWRSILLGLATRCSAIDRRGVGDSEGVTAALKTAPTTSLPLLPAFRAEAPQIERLVAFGNCDAATALAFQHEGVDALALANPWVIEAAASRSRRADPAKRRRRPRAILGKAEKPAQSDRLADGQDRFEKAGRRSCQGSTKRSAKRVGGAARHLRLPLRQFPPTILVAERDTTALAFLGAYKDAIFDPVRARPNITLSRCDSASHSFADATAKAWLYEQIERALKAA